MSDFPGTIVQFPPCACDPLFFFFILASFPKNSQKKKIFFTKKKKKEKENIYFECFLRDLGPNFLQDQKDKHDHIVGLNLRL